MHLAWCQSVALGNVIGRSGGLNQPAVEPGLLERAPPLDLFTRVLSKDSSEAAASRLGAKRTRTRAGTAAVGNDASRSNRLTSSAGASFGSLSSLSAASCRFPSRTIVRLILVEPDEGLHGIEPAVGDLACELVDLVMGDRLSDDLALTDGLTRRRNSRILRVALWANQLRVLLTATAYVLLQELQLRAEGTSLARAQVVRLRLVLRKLGARHPIRPPDRLSPAARPSRSDAWRAISASLGAAAA